MKSRGIVLVGSIMLGILLLTPMITNVLGHAPLDQDTNDSLETATIIPDASKSYVLYNDLHDTGIAQYYRFSLDAGERLYFTVFLSPNPEYEGTLLGVAIMGPGIEDTGSIPSFLEKPTNAGVEVFEGSAAEEATFEGFTPSTFYDLWKVDRTVKDAGEYYIAIFTQNIEVEYGMAIGYRETFTLTEWLGIPIQVLGIYQWEGQPLIEILLPFLITVFSGIILLGIAYRKYHIPRQVPQWLVAISGILMLGSTALLFTQLGFVLGYAPLGVEVIVTIVIATIPALLGIGLFRQVIAVEKGLSNSTRIKLLALGIGGLFAWAGLYAGPILAVLVALSPNRKSKDKDKPKKPSAHSEESQVRQIEGPHEIQHI